MQLAGKVAIVTGSSRGIGKAIALAYAKEGADMVVVGRSETADRLPGTIHQTAAEVRALGRRALSVRCDVSSEEDVQRMVQQAQEEFGRIDVLVNNAGVIFHTNIVDTLVRRWDLIVRVNLRGTFLCCKYVLPIMMQQRSGSIISLTSRASYEAKPGTTAYGLTKAGIERLTTGLAEEVREYTIAVNALDPGLIRTEGALYAYPKDFDWSGWDLSPEVVCGPALFLAAQDARSFTGRVVRVREFGKTWP